MAISSIGVGSGLPIEDLLADLRKAESQPLNLIKQRQQLTEARLSAYGIIKGGVSDLQKSAKALQDSDNYGALKATSGNADVIGVKVDNTAVAGNYNIQVSQLATQHSLVAKGQESRTDNIGSGGSLAVTLANNGESHSIDLGDDTSLEGIMKSINANSDLGVQATLVNDGSGSPHRLMLTSTDTGTEAAIDKIEISNNSQLANVLNYNSEDNTDKYDEGVKAQDAKININGVDITSQNNTVEGAIEGVTLDLKAMQAEGDAAIKVSVSRDDSVTTNAIKDFVKEYNKLLDTIQKQTSFDVEGGQSSVLTGDSLVRRIENQMRSALNGATGSGDINTLADLGIKTDYKTGRLEIDDDKLAEAVKNNLNDVTEFFSGDNGLAARVDNTAEDFVKAKGLINNTEDSINSTLKMLQTQYENTSDRIDTKMENYRRQFSQLDVMMSQMNGISDYLTQQLDMLANMTTNKK